LQRTALAVRAAGTGSQACRPLPTLGHGSRAARTKCAARAALCNRARAGDARARAGVV